MTSTIRRFASLVVLLLFVTIVRAGDEPLTRVQIARIGKAATALVEVKSTRGQGTGSAFCIRRDGWYLTNAHVAQGELTLVLDAGLKTEKSFPARVVRSDPDLDLALLRVEGTKDLPALTLGTDEGLEELMEVVAFGYPFGTSLREISVNPGPITALRHEKTGQLQRIQLAAALNPGNSGGPVLDQGGKVIGVVVSGVVVASGNPRRGEPIRGAPTGLNFAIPVSIVSRFLARPDVQFSPPALGAGALHKPVTFEARVTPLLPSAAPLNVDLILRAGHGPERTARMKADGDRYRLTAVPIPGEGGPVSLRLAARFEDGSLEGTTTDRKFTAGGREVALADVRTIRPGSPARLSLRDGTTITGALTGLDAVPVPVGPQTLSARLDRAKEVDVKPVGEVQEVACTLVVRLGDKEVYRRTEDLGDAGLLNNPGFEAGFAGWTRFTTKGAEPQFDIDTNVAREGRQSVRISVTQLSDSGIYQDIVLKPGHRYRLSGWVRTRGLNPYGAGAYGTFLVQGPTVPVSPNPQPNHGGDTEWTEVRLAFQAPADGRTRIVACHVNFGMGTGTAWFDDLRLVDLDESAISAASLPANGTGFPAGQDVRGGDDQGPAGEQPDGGWLPSPARLALYATAILAVLSLIIVVVAIRRRWWGQFGSRMKRGATSASDLPIHPDTDVLALFAAGRLRAAEMERIGEHLAECPACLQELERLPEDALVGLLREHGDWSEGSPPEPGAGPNRKERPGRRDSTRRSEPVEMDHAEHRAPGPTDHPRYKLKTLLGHGGMGLIYLADDRQENRDVVLKFLREDLLDRPRLVERFRREAAAATRLKHRNIVEAYGIEPFGRWPALVMEYVRGTDLARLIEKAGPVPVRVGCELIRQAAIGLQYSFEQGMVHRDVKPSNLIVSTAGTVKILDFGLAKMQSELSVDAGFTSTGAFLGSVDYIAPEQIEDPRVADIRADIYSLGCTLYHLLSGVPPFQGTTFEVLEAHRAQKATPLHDRRPEVPQELGAVVARMMAKEPGRRFQSPVAVARALSPFRGTDQAMERTIAAKTGAAIVTEAEISDEIRVE